MNIKRIPQLPHWCLTDLNPAFYDTESLSVVEQTARLYGKMSELVSEYNNFANEVNKTIVDFVTGVNTDQEEFEKSINDLVHNYIILIDSKIAHQDRVIEENITYIRNNISAGITQIINEMKENGEFDDAITEAFDSLNSRVERLEENKILCSYDITTESLTLVNIGGVE